MTDTTHIDSNDSIDNTTIDNTEQAYAPYPAEDAAAQPAGDKLPARDRLVITLLLISAFVVILNETIMGVALPQLMTDLDITASSAQWLSTAFMLTMAVVIPITGFLLQRYNTKPVFIAAMTLFSTGTFIAAVSPGFEILLAARVVQASGTAIMMPLLFTTVMTLVPPAIRGRIIGNISIVISVAPALGPTISGLILSVLDWRWMFILVLPIAVAALIYGATKMVNVTTPISTRIDVLSVVLSAFGFGGIVFGLSNLGGASVVTGWVSLGIGLVALAVFILRQLSLQKRDAALLDLRTFTHGTFSVSIGAVAVAMMALFGTIILLPMYAQNVLGLEPLDTGLMLLPGGLLMGLLAPTVGRLYDKNGPRVLLIAGTVATAAALWGFTLLNENSPFWWVIVGHIILSLGFALLFTPLFTSGLADLPPNLYSHGSAVLGTVQQLAGAAGTAIFVTVMASQAFQEVQAGAADAAATASGIRLAFTYGAAIFLLAIPAVFFIRRSADTQHGAPAH